MRRIKGKTLCQHTEKLITREKINYFIFIWFGRIKQNLYDALVLLFFLTETFNLNSVNCHYQCLWNLWEFQWNFYSKGFMLPHTILISILCINLNTLILMIQCSLCFVFKILPAANRVTGVFGTWFHFHFALRFILKGCVIASKSVLNFSPFLMKPLSDYKSIKY